MTVFLELPRLFQIIILIDLLLLLVVNIFNFLLCHSYKVKTYFTVFAFLQFFICFILLVALDEGLKYQDELKDITEIGYYIISSDYRVIISILILLNLISFIYFIYLMKWNNRHVTKVAINESLEKMPIGICFYDETGKVLLFNNRINQLCYDLKGNYLTNVADLWDDLFNGNVNEHLLVYSKGINPIIKHSDNKVMSYSRIMHTINRNKVYELIAFDITAEYELKTAYEEKNKELQELNIRLREYGEKITEYTRDKEILSAKIRIHDDLGRLLLLSKTYANTEDLTKRRYLIDEWKTTIKYFGSIRKQNTSSSEFEEIFKAANDIGVKIIYEGVYPEYKSIYEKIIINAIHECLTNTVIHACGDEVYVSCKKENMHYIVNISNNGEKPRKEIIEKGGLHSLRTLLEREGGKMKVTSFPSFNLLITLPITGGENGKN